jgi:hypothetical protein
MRRKPLVESDRKQRKRVVRMDVIERRLEELNAEASRRWNELERQRWRELVLERRRA